MHAEAYLDTLNALTMAVSSHHNSYVGRTINSSLQQHAQGTGGRARRRM